MNKSLEKVALPIGLGSLTFGLWFNLPSGQQSWTVDANWNQSLEKVALPSGLLSLTFGLRFYHSLEKGALPSGLQSSIF